MLALLLACVHSPPDDTPRWEPPVLTPRATLAPGLSDAVVDVMLTYPRDGSFGFDRPPDDGVWWGTTRELPWYLGQLVSTADPQHRSHCVGLTWEVAMTVLQAAAGEGAINGMTLDDLAMFRSEWFVRELRGVGAPRALEQFGVGTRVPLEEARRGDFIQMWTVGASGHSAIFDRWIERDGRVVGLRYWSTHPALSGVGYWIDPFTPWGLDPERIYVGRISPVGEWRPRELGTEG